MRALARPVLAALAAACLVSACIEEQRYVIENQAVALTADVAPAFITEDDDPIFIVTRDFEFPIAPPKNTDLARLTQRASGLNLPFPRAPWVEHTDIELELSYALENLGDAPITASVTLDGRNEFFQYAPGPEDLHQWERRHLLQPKERVHGVVTELEMDEIAVDLATVVNGAPNSNLVVQFQSQSGRDERTRQYIPALIPGLTGIRAGIMTGASGSVVLEISVRAQDHGGRVPTRGQKRWTLPEPTDFAPVVPEDT